MIDGAELSEARYERKFLVTGMSLAQVRHVVRMNPLLFRPLFEPRWINNIYFDSIDLTSYRDTIEGVRDRIKIRVRWYGDTTGTIEYPVLELKRKRGFVTVKDGFPLGRWETGTRFSSDTLLSVLAQADLPVPTHELLKSTRPTLFNRYMRSYSISHCTSYRITIDHDQCFQRVADESCFGQATSIPDLVLEIKYGLEAEPGVQSITQHLPFRLSKSSKYAVGVQLTAP